MKILYISPINIKSANNDLGNSIEYNFPVTTKLIKNAIEAALPNTAVTMITDIVVSESGETRVIKEEEIGEFNLVFCDITTLNPNVLFHAGKLESWGKPIIYFHANNSIFSTVFVHRRKLSYSTESLLKEFLDELLENITLAETDPSSFMEISQNKETKAKVFISYSHQNRSYIDRLLVHLKPLTKQGILDVWEDKNIKTGDYWQKEIEKALENSTIAVLMISADFMASDFIVDNELPPLLAKASVKGTKILPVIVSHCRFSREPTLSVYQAANSPENPLSSMSEDEKERIYDQVALDIESSLEGV